ncbi:phenylacetate--CoA ligase family protein [Nonomuraea pusilla]|uniref:Phenylacetate-CoA ligase n=1 Tax=Nonomuraea pusilla TaxID=46177 RepID=A0A1H8J3W9_9ACTN|nr:phenylacetate--CoA ligase family protein [Nonomuraea pusilla]SEN75633.1 phenylacetate-CoA ligase [Nonomuraea pusilla]
MSGLPATIPVVPVLWNLGLARARERLPPARLRAVQDRLLTRLVRHAHARVPYYRRTLPAAAVATLRGAGGLAALPVLDRATLRDLPAGELLAEGFTPGNTREAPTSGSSGVPVRLRYSERDLGYLRATYLHDLLASGLRPWDRIGYFRVGGFRRHRLERLGLARNVHVNTGLGLDEQAEAFLAGRPTFLWGFPGAIATLVDELLRRGVAYRGVHTVVFAGEATTPAAREHVLGYFGARGHEVYASVEAYTIARSCPRGSLHLRSADVVVEVLHDDGTSSLADGEGEILVTRLHAEAMPLVRYRLGDRVLIEPDDCGCGVLRTPIVRRIQGRAEDRVVTADGRALHADFLTNPRILPTEGVRRFQIVQRRPGAVEILLVPGPSAPGDLAETVRRAVAGAAHGLEVTARTVDAIDAEPNGKVRLVKTL